MKLSSSAGRQKPVNKIVINKILQLIITFCFVLLIILSCEDKYDPEITGSIKGIVKDAKSLEPVPNAEISTNPATEVFLSDEKGKFLIENIDTGAYKLIINKAQYNSKILNIRVKENDTASANVMLEKKETSTNTPPEFQNNFSPASGSTNLPTSLDLSWQVKQTELSDSLAFDVLLYRSDSQSYKKIVSNYKDNTIHIEELNYNTVYYWQVIAKNEAGDTVHSEIQNFKTQQLPQASFFYSKKINGNYEIMGYNIESGSSTRITYNSLRDWAPKLNHTNAKIAFVSDSLVKNLIFTMSKSGQNIQRVSDIPVAGYNNYGNAFCWNDRTGHIFFSHYSDLYRVNQDGTGLNTIATAPAGRHFRELDVSEKGDKIIALTIGEESYTNEIYIMDIDGTDMTQVIGNMAGTIEAPGFSIDGKSILFTHDISEHEAIDGRQLNSHIFSYSFDTQDTTDLSVNKPLGTNDLYPRYSNTGDRIVFVNVKNDNSNPHEIWTMNTDGTNREKLITSATLPYW